MVPCVKEADVAEMKADIKNLFKKVDKQEKTLDAIHGLTAEIKVLSSEVSSMKTGQTELKKDVEDLKDKPRQRWESIVLSIISAVVGGLVVFMFYKAGLRP